MFRNNVLIFLLNEHPLAMLVFYVMALLIFNVDNCLKNRGKLNE